MWYAQVSSTPAPAVGQDALGNFSHPSWGQDASFALLAAGLSNPKPFEEFLHEVMMRCCAFRGEERLSSWSCLAWRRED